MTLACSKTRTLPASVLRVLAVVLSLADARRPITIRGINRRLGWSEAPNYTAKCLDRLRAAGLVTWRRDAASGGRAKATIQPTCRMELWR